MRQHQRRRRIAGDDHGVGPRFRDETAHDGDDAPDEIVGAPVAVGKARIVGRIDEIRMRQRLRDLAKDGEAARPESKTRMRGAGIAQRDSLF